MGKLYHVTEMHPEVKLNMRVQPRAQLIVCVIELHDILCGTVPILESGVDFCCLAGYLRA